MNKLFIVLLAVCLVAVHGYVKRDAPPADDTGKYLDNVKTTLEEFSKNVNEKFRETFSADEVKKNLDELFNGVNKLFEDSKTKKA